MNWSTVVSKWVLTAAADGSDAYRIVIQMVKLVFTLLVIEAIENICPVCLSAGRCGTFLSSRIALGCICPLLSSIHAPLPVLQQQQ